VSDGCPCTGLIDRTYVAMAIAQGLDAVFMDTRDTELVDAVVTAELLLERWSTVIRSWKQLAKRKCNHAGALSGPRKPEGSGQCDRALSGLWSVHRIFTDEPKRHCRCGRVVLRESLPQCATWCAAAAACLGQAIDVRELESHLSKLKNDPQAQQCLRAIRERLQKKPAEQEGP